MKVLIAHVPYQHRGGEDVHVDVLAKAYQNIGIEVAFLPSSRAPSPAPLQASARSLLPGHSFPEVQAAWEASRASFIHLHNAFPDLGPRFFRWVIANRVPMLMTVHNHRFYCSNGIALREGRICKECLTASLPWRPVVHNCNGERKKSIYHALALGQMRLGNLYARAVGKFIAPSPYIAAELVKSGIPDEKVVHLLNPIPDPQEECAEVLSETPTGLPPADVFYAGRLSIEKGVDKLCTAAALAPDLHFLIAGGGPLLEILRRRAPRNITFLGAISRPQVVAQIRASKVCALPSVCNEILPTFVLESYFLGKRCIVPDLESTRWLAGVNYPGHLANPMAPESLIQGIRTALSAAPPSGEQLTRIRDELGFGKFTKRLQAIVAETLAFTGAAPSGIRSS